MTYAIRYLILVVASAIVLGLAITTIAGLFPAMLAIHTISSAVRAIRGSPARGVT